MAKAKKKLLPKDFDALLKGGDIATLKAVFDVCDVNARGGYSKQSALAFRDCPDDLMIWLVEQGADIDARNTYHRTPLHEHAVGLNGKIETLLDLGSDIQAIDKDGDTPLHNAAKFASPTAVRILLDRGARADVLNLAKLTPLEAGLGHCSNSQITSMANISDLLMVKERPQAKGLLRFFKPGSDSKNSAGASQTRAFVQRIGENFEFHRAGFNPEYVDATSAALDHLYQLFDVPPVPRRTMHDGKKLIIAKSVRWQDRHEELWALLVPSKGAAATVQGEVIRITGRIADEIDRNGGVNWDGDYRKMARDFLTHIHSGSPLPDVDLERARRVVTEIRDRDGAGSALCELAVRWVGNNPDPVALNPPDYSR